MYGPKSCKNRRDLFPVYMMYNVIYDTILKYSKVYDLHVSAFKYFLILFLDKIWKLLTHYAPFSL